MALWIQWTQTPGDGEELRLGVPQYTGHKESRLSD